MEFIDVIIAVLLVVGLIGGIRDGLVKQICGLMGLIVGLLVGKTVYKPVGDWLIGALSLSAEIAHIMAFILILLLVPLLFSLMGWLVSKFLGVISLGWLNRLLGGLVGVLKYALFVGIVIIGIEMFDKDASIVSKTCRETSILYNPIYRASSLFLYGVKR